MVEVVEFTCLKEILIPKRFNLGGYIVAILCGLVGAIFIGLTKDLSKVEQRQFRCEREKNFVQTRCFDQYNKAYNSPLPLYVYTILTFSSLVAVCIIYSFCVRARVNQIEVDLTPDIGDVRPLPILRRSSRVYCSYLIQLLIRFGLTISFIISVQGRLKYPSQYYCHWDPVSKRTTMPSVTSNTTKSNSSSVIDCHNSNARDKNLYSKAMWYFYIALACFLFIETFYLIARACHNKTFTYDSEFCKKYFLNRNRISTFILDFQSRIIEKTELLDPVLIPGEADDEKNNNRLAIDKIYIDLIIYPGRITHKFQGLLSRNELLQVYLIPPEHSVRISPEQLFLHDQKSFKKVLIVGRPGIGKSLLSTKIIREWSKGTLFGDTEKSFKYVFLFRFRHFNSENMKNMSLKELFSRSEFSAGAIHKSVFESIINEADKVLLIFDGLDEFKQRGNLLKDETEVKVKNDPTDVIPVSALYVKLIQNDLLSGATILTTTRPHAVECVRSIGLDNYRVVEIMGFTPDKVESYVKNSCKGVPDIANRIWEHIKGNLNLLYLCYVPTTCSIVSALLKYTIMELQNSHPSIPLPTTLTEVYRGGLRLFLFKHHPKYRERKKQDFIQQENIFFESVEKQLAKLGLLAEKGIRENRFVFEEKEVRELKHCGLLNSMPSKQRTAFTIARPSEYCFLHLTLQEFLVARHIVRTKDSTKILDFIQDKIDKSSAQWHLVIQFIAGLLQGHEEFNVVKNFFVETLYNSLQVYDNKKLALLMMRAMSELHGDEATEEALSKLVLSTELNFSYSDMTSLDCNCIVYHLKKNNSFLRRLNVKGNYLLGDSGCAQLSMILKEKSLETLIMSGCNVSDDGIKAITGESDWAKPCGLRHLNIGFNQITDQGIITLCRALQLNNCQLSELLLYENNISNEGMLYLCNAVFKHEKCRLTHLDVHGNPQISDEGISHLHNSLNLSYKKSPLSHLDLHDNPRITDKGVSILCDVLVNKNCSLFMLNLQNTSIANEGISRLCNALKHKNCNLNWLFLGSDKITDQDVQCLCKALQNPNCQLTKLKLESSALTTESVQYLCEALKDTNCKVIEIDIQPISMEDRSQLYKAIKERGLNHSPTYPRRPHNYALTRETQV